jgi:hypothetical protein
VTVQGFTIDDESSFQEDKSRKQQCAILHCPRSPDIENCSITSSSQCCIAIAGQTAKPLIHHCDIQWGGIGIAVSEQGQGTVEDCQICGQTVGVAIGEYSHLEIRRCQICQGQWGIGLANIVRPP